MVFTFTIINPTSNALHMFTLNIEFAFKKKVSKRLQGLSKKKQKQLEFF